MFLVSGATGNVGAELVRALVSAGEQVRALTHGVRSPAWPSGVEVVTGDLNQPGSLSSGLRGVQGVFLLSGYADMSGLLSEMAGAGVDRVVLLSSGAVVGGDAANAVVRYNMVSEEAARDSGLPWTILRPSGFHANALQWVPQLRAGTLCARRSPTCPSRPSTRSTSQPSPPWRSRCRATTVPPTVPPAPSPSFPPTGSGSWPASSTGNYSSSP